MNGFCITFWRCVFRNHCEGSRWAAARVGEDKDPAPGTCAPTSLTVVPWACGFLLLSGVSNWVPFGCCSTGSMMIIIMWTSEGLCIRLGYTCFKHDIMAHASEIFPQKKLNGGFPAMCTKSGIKRMRVWKQRASCSGAEGCALVPHWPFLFWVGD